MLKKAAIATAIAYSLAANSVYAEDDQDIDKWVAGFLQAYESDADKPQPRGYLDDGKGFGFEVGIRYAPKWAARFEYVRQDIDVDPTKGFGSDEIGNSFGIDAMYFLEDDVAYIFGGGRIQDLSDTYSALAVGVGKHWTLNDRFRLVTEVVGFHDFGQDYNDYAFKLGLAYAFGDKAKSSSAAPKDSDNDGVMDSRDLCPNTPAGQAVDATGCNNDLDRDGVVNNADQCPNTPAGTKVDAKGCALIADSDKDGVNDNLDKCPNTPKGDKVDARGCTEFVENEVSVSLNVLFANNSSIVENTSSSQIVEFANFLKRYGSTSVTIEGHTSAVGTADYNLYLSQKRAQAIVNVLVEQYGIDANRLSAVGYGETRLLNSANNAEAHRVNRRIEAKVSTMVKEKLTNN
jgi:OOP family OmpA-OmpF porin